jgi:competence protein ComGC
MSEIPNVLPHLNELRATWRRQNFNFTESQQEEYEMLLATRRERVKELYSEGRVSKSKAKAVAEY